MKKVIILNKKEGETPLEALENFRKKNPEYLNVPMTYAGRLDPMASGVLLILAGEETKNKEKYLALDKEYEFDVLFGFSTDTYDILGKVTEYIRQDMAHIRHGVYVKKLESDIKKNLKSFTGEIIQKYPMYSSKTVKGKPLFTYAREGEEVEIPTRKVSVKKLKLENIKYIDNNKLFKNIEKRINKVKGPARNALSIAYAGGDFRQKEILSIWEKELSIKNKFLIASFKIKCSSGTYVRTIANSLGNELKIPALAFLIKRTKIGRYSLI